MKKSIIPNFDKWTTDEKRLLVILLLVIIYPVFVTSFYGLYLFVILPLHLPPNLTRAQAHHEGWYHIYWLFVTLLWVILCTFILPFFDKRKVQIVMDLGSVENPPYDARFHTEPVDIDVKDKYGSQGSLSKRSYNSTDIKKDGSDLEVDIEGSLKKSRESLSKSYSSLERQKITQSGEFLNDFMTTMKAEETEKSETVCEVHAVQMKGRGKYDDYSEEDKLLSEERKPTERTHEEIDTTEEPSDKTTHPRKLSSLSEDSSDEEQREPLLQQTHTRPHTQTPMKINEATVQHNDQTQNMEETEEVEKLDDSVPQERRKKAKPTIDTSRASGYYECSLPTPKSIERQSSQNNTVFLYVNPDTAATEENILLSHSGVVEEAEGVKKDGKV